MYNILDFTLDELKIWMKDNNENVFRAKQVIGWIYKKVFRFEEMKNIPKNLQEKLKDNFEICMPEVVQVYNSQLDDTKKVLFKLKDGNLIESVLMKYKYGNSICVSTQIGCRMGCKFCASTIDGMIRNLSAGEIISQILMAEKILDDRISNVVLMGSGEPFDNFDNVIKFFDIVTSDYSLNIGQRHITVSTCGIVPKIYEFADKGTQITLAISLHASKDEQRKKIMPISNKYSIEEVLKACKYYINTTKRRVTFEYSLVKGVNDSKDDAKNLSDLLKELLCHVNLIPVNEIKENSFEKSSEKTIANFKNILESKGIDVTVRREMGSDINAACGQLRRSYIKSEEN